MQELLFFSFVKQLFLITIDCERYFPPLHIILSNFALKISTFFSTSSHGYTCVIRRKKSEKKKLITVPCKRIIFSCKRRKYFLNNQERKNRFKLPCHSIVLPHPHGRLTSFQLRKGFNNSRVP